NQGHAKAIAMRFDRQARHGVELLRLEGFEVFSMAQRKQRTQEIELHRRFDGHRDQIKEYRQQSEISADRPQQDEKDQRQGDGADQHEEFGSDAETPQRLERPDVGGCGRGIARYDDLVPDVKLVEEAQDNDDQVQYAADPGHNLGRGFDPVLFHVYSLLGISPQYGRRAQSLQRVACSSRPQRRHLQPQMLLERLVARAGVQEGEAHFESEGGDEAFDDGGGGVALGQQDAGVAGGDAGEVEAADFDARELAQGGFHQLLLPLVQIPREHFGVDQVADTHPTRAQGTVQEVRLRSDGALEVVDPDGGVREEPHPRLRRSRVSSGSR